MNSMTFMDAGKKDASYFDGICRIIESAGKNGVQELHFEGLSLFLTSNGQMLVQQSRKPELVKNTVAEMTSLASHRIMSEEKRALLDEQRRMFDQDLDNLDLEDPVAADRLARAEVEEG